MAPSGGLPSIGADTIQMSREQLADGGEPLNTESRNVIEMHGSIYANITKYAERTLDLSKGDSVDVHCFPECVVIVPDGKEVEDGE